MGAKISIPPKKRLERKHHVNPIKDQVRGVDERRLVRSNNAFELRCQGWTYEAIADHFGCSIATVYTDIDRIREELAKQVTPLAEREREIMAGQCRQIIAKFAPVVLNGDVAVMLDRNGNPVLSEDRIKAIAKASEVIVKAQERIAKLYGLDAPTQVISEVTNRYANDEELAARVAEAEAGESPLVAAHSGKIVAYRSRAGAAQAVEKAA